jgi:DNA-binding CsgD family transcriptional regulator
MGVSVRIVSGEVQWGTAAPLRGRQAQLRSLCAALLELSGGAPLRCVVSGEAGSGKSRLVGEAFHSAEGLGVSVLSSRALELAPERALGTILDALGVMNGDEREQAERTQVARVVAVVKRLCAGAPTLLILEDAQWADRMAVASLSRLLDECRGEPLGVLLTLRPFPSNPAVDDLIDQERHGFTRVHLDGLGPGEVAEVLQDLAGAVPGPRLRRLAAGAAGNPRLLGALVACVRRESALYRIGGVVETDRDLPPLSMWPVVQARMSRLSDRCQDLLTIAAALEQPWDMTALTRAAGRPLVDLVKDLRELVAAGLLTAEAAQLRFRHDLVRAVLRQTVPAATERPLASSRGVRQASPARGASGRPAIAVAPETPSWNTQLTAAEREVVSLVALGLSNKQVAARLAISPRTVESHLAHVFGKLGVGSRVELAVAVARSVSATAAARRQDTVDLRSATA